MALIGRELCFADLLIDPADEQMIERLRSRPIHSVLDIGCAEGMALLASRYMFGSNHLEGIEETDLENQIEGIEALNRERDKCRPPEGNAWPMLIHPEYEQHLLITYADVHDYQFLLPSYDLIILSNVIHYWSEANARHTMDRVTTLIGTNTIVYLRIKLGLDPNGFMDEDRMDDKTMEALTVEYANKWGLQRYMQLVEGDEHYTFTNIK